MMLLQANAESGTNGTQLTAGGDFDTISNGTSGSTVYDNTHPLSGNLSYKTVAGTGNTYAGWSTSLGGAKSELWLRVYCQIDAYYSGGICYFRSGGALAGKVGTTAAGKINVWNGANTILQTSSTTLGPSSVFRIELHGIASASPTGGTLEVRIFATRDGITPTEVLGPFTATQTAATFEEAWFGPVGGGSGATLFYDDVAASDVGWVGPTGTASTTPAATNNPPIPTGATNVGSTLYASSPGTWTGNPAPVFTYQWRRCDSSGANAVAISGATNQSYTLTSADLGSTLRIAVTGTNTAGAATSASSYTATVSAAASTVNSLANSFDGTDGTAVTSVSTGTSGDALDEISITAGGSLVFKSSDAPHAGASVKATANGVSAYVGWTGTSYGPVQQSFARMYLKFTALPSAGSAVIRFRLGSTTAASINVANTGIVKIRDSSGAQLATGTSAIPLGSWVRLEAFVNGSSTTGQVIIRLYLQKDGDVVTEEVTTASNLALPASIDTVEFGLVGNASAGDTLLFDAVAVDTTWIGADQTLGKRWGWGMVAAPPETGVSEPPLTVTSTVIGYNPNAPEGDYFATYFGKTPIARCYNNSRALPSNGSDFVPGGFAYNSANVGLSGHTSGKRINMSVIYDPGTVTNSSSALAVQMQNYAASVPAGWLVQVVLYHEYNLHTTDYGGDGSNGRTIAQFVNSFPILANAISAGDAGRGRCIAVINPSYGNGSFQNLMVPNASLMPQGSELHMDVYNNPSGNPSGYKAYGCAYRTASQIMTNIYKAIDQLGYASANYGWGIDEFGTPRRVAPKLSSLNTTLGWGPLSPYDIDGSGMAAAINDFVNWCLNAPVKPTTLIFFTGTGSWNQSVKTAGTASKDDGTSGSPGAHYQGFPINVDPTKPMNAYKAFITASP